MPRRVWFPLSNTLPSLPSLEECVPTFLPFPYLHLYPQHGGLAGHAEDVLIAQPEVPADGAESLLVLLPVTVEAAEAHLASLDKSPTSTVGLHVTEHLRRQWAN